MFFAKNIKIIIVGLILGLFSTFLVVRADTEHGTPVPVPEVESTAILTEENLDTPLPNELPADFDGVAEVAEDMAEVTENTATGTQSIFEIGSVVEDVHATSSAPDTAAGGEIEKVEIVKEEAGSDLETAKADEEVVIVNDDSLEEVFIPSQQFQPSTPRDCFTTEALDYYRHPGECIRVLHGLL